MFKLVDGLQEYVVAPEALRIALSPEHIVELEVAILIAGPGETYKSIVKVSAHPLISTPITVYVAGIDGFAKMELPVEEDNPNDGLHVYVRAPVATRFAFDPIHKTEKAGVAVTIGGVNTVMGTEAKALHPFKSVPITE